MAVTAVENLKGFTSSRPPFVIFTICILLFAIILISLGSYIKHHDMQDYDIDYDWNILMHEFSKLEFCLQPNDTQKNAPPTTTTTAAPSNVTSTTTTTTTTDEFDYPVQNTTLSVSLSLRAHEGGHTEAHLGTTHLISMFSVSELGIDGAIDEKMSVSFEFHEPLKKLHCTDSGCTKKTLKACLMIVAPEGFLPQTRHPGPCNITETTKREKLTKMNVKSKIVKDPVMWCNTGTVAKTVHHFDPRLTVMLSPAQRNLVNMHLMYTSYFLFVMLITCVCYALMKGPRKHRTITLGATSSSSSSTINEKKISVPI